MNVPHCKVLGGQLRLKEHWKPRMLCQFCRQFYPLRQTPTHRSHPNPNHSRVWLRRKPDSFGELSVEHLSGQGRLTAVL